MPGKNYPYLAIQVQRFCNSYSQRQLRYAFQDLKLSEAEDLELSGAAEVMLDHEDRAGRRVAPSEHSRMPSEVSLRTGAGFEGGSFHLGFQTLFSIVAVHLRHAIRRWATFSRRKHFEERQSQVVHALRNVQAEMDNKMKQQPASSNALSPASEVSPSAAYSPNFAESVTSTPHFRRLDVGHMNVVTQGHATHFTKKTQDSPGLHSDDLVKSLCEDQARVDEVIKLAAILWDNLSLANMQPNILPQVLMKASLLARTAERCQRHVMREAMHLLWKSSTLQRSVEELLAKGELMKCNNSRSSEAVPQHVSHSHVPQVQQHIDFHVTDDVSQEDLAEPSDPVREELAREVQEDFETSKPKVHEEGEELQSTVGASAGWDALATAVTSHAPPPAHAMEDAHPKESKANAEADFVVTQPIATAPDRSTGPHVAYAAESELNSDESDAEESDIDDDALLAGLG